MKICAILRNAETIQVVHWRKSCFYTFQFEVPFKFRSSFVSLLGTSQIFHLALHFIAGEGMKCFPCLADSFLICPGALGFPTSCTICGALAPNGPELLVTRYTTNIPDTLRHQQSIQRGLKKYRCNFHDVICHLVLISLIGFFFKMNL